MRPARFWILFALMVIAQIILYNYTPANPYVMLTILPVAVLLIPIKYNTPVSLLVAFVAGLVADILADGLIGLNVFALVPVAFCREFIISLFFGEEMFARRKNISFARNGVGKVSLTILISQAIFLTFYICADLIGSRSFWFCLMRFFASLAMSFPLGLLVTNCLTKESEGKWK